MKEWLRATTSRATGRSSRRSTAWRRSVGATVTAVALRWLVQKPAVTSVIMGVRTAAQLDDNLKAGELRLSPEAMKRLDDASAFELGYPYDFMKRIQGRW